MTKFDAATVREAETAAEVPARAAGKPSSFLTNSLPMGPMGSARRAMATAVNAVFHGISEMFRLVRAYNDLARLDHGTLRAIGGRRGELDRILGGHPPRKTRHDPEAVGAAWMAEHKKKG